MNENLAAFIRFHQDEEGTILAKFALSKGHSPRDIIDLILSSWMEDHPDFFEKMESTDCEQTRDEMAKYLAGLLGLC